MAIVGASADRHKYSNKALRAHLRDGWQVYPVNPKGGRIEGLKVCRSLREIPVRLQRVALYLPPEAGLSVLPDVAAVRPVEFLVNPGAESPELVEAARGLGLDPILACTIVALGESPADY